MKQSRTHLTDVPVRYEAAGGLFLWICQCFRAASGGRVFPMLPLLAGQTSSCHLRAVPINEPQMQAIVGESAPGGHAHRHGPGSVGAGWVQANVVLSRLPALHPA